MLNVVSQFRIYYYVFHHKQMLHMTVLLNDNYNIEFQMLLHLLTINLKCFLYNIFIFEYASYNAK